MRINLQQLSRQRKSNTSVSLHCNFMINDGTATAHDLELLGESVRERVFDHSGIELQWEIKRLGNFLEKQKIISFQPVAGKGQ